ncbi:hypothetical protein N180_03070 [Pedobacter antarcticus 4BY]|uniref:Uncharacterized protein n=2 Tax=Pedobacter antarcticus TaxID=34086 RepID=A0A081PKM0_9SPHI|nr:hypothetical protein [Pedobacter antarcticus]KEQ31243.1 hypothetical protein N180_03070 [Pedobacter antarcticus 4BY]SFE56143.1 hypothetical protein SAMN03003324_00899 [Pedobacter antarcticus]
MDVSNLAEPVPGISLVRLVEGIKEGQELPFNPKRERYLRTMVSSTIKDRYPSREYSVNLEEDNSAVIVKRSFDKKMQ